MIVFLFCWSKANFIWKISNFKFQVINLGVVSWCSVNYATEGNRTKISSKACKNVLLFFFLSSSFFLLTISDRVGRKYLCRQDLRIRVLKITQNDISHPKWLMIKGCAATFLLVCFVYLQESTLKQEKMFFNSIRKLFSFLR